MIQADKSRVRFEVGHHDYGKPVEGRFRQLSGQIDYDPDAVGSRDFSVSVAIVSASIDTDNEFRDDHLRSSFFEADAFPSIEFEASGISAGQPRSLDGTLTIKGVKRPVSLQIASLREVVAEDGSATLRCRASGSLSRREFGVQENLQITSGLEGILSSIQQGLDGFIDDRVRFSITVVGSRSAD